MRESCSILGHCSSVCFWMVFNQSILAVSSHSILVTFHAHLISLTLTKLIRKSGNKLRETSLCNYIHLSINLAFLVPNIHLRQIIKYSQLDSLILRILWVYSVLCFLVIIRRFLIACDVFCFLKQLSEINFRTECYWKVFCFGH